jgi:hypothetical protein
VQSDGDLSKYQRYVRCTSSVQKSCTVKLEALDSFKMSMFLPGCRGMCYRRDSFHSLRRVEPANCSQQLQVHAAHTKNCYVVPPEDGRLTPETCRGLRHNIVFVKVKVY